MGLAHKPEPSRIIQFVSAAERKFDVISHPGIHERVTVGVWSKAVAAFAEQIKQGRIAEGFLATIEILGTQLARHMPAEGENPNRLSDVLIELHGS
jgi:putative membrane protein